MDRFRLTDPDAAEKAARIYWDGVNNGMADAPAMQAVLDHIEPEQPHLPTRSQVEARFRRVAVGGWPAGRDSEFMVTPRSVASVLIDTGWATEDPEPEVDPAHVEADEVTDTLRAVAQYLMGRGPAPDIDALTPELRDQIDELLPAIVELVGDRIVPAEPEVDPAQVEALAKLLHHFKCECSNYSEDDMKNARSLVAAGVLASGRVQVTP